MAFNQSLIDSPLATQKTQQVQQQQQQAQQMDAPGAAWMNKRAEEEYQRAMEYVVDHDFNLGMLLIYGLPWLSWYRLGWDVLIIGWYR